MVLVQLFGKNLHLAKGMGVKSWGVLCLGIHGTWRTGGADAGAAASVSKKDEEGEAGSVSVFWYKFLLFQCPRDLPGAGELVSNL